MFYEVNSTGFFIFFMTHLLILAVFNQFLYFVFVALFAFGKYFIKGLFELFIEGC